ncbi:G-protein coupled receptor family C group 6 member A-like [Megalobrama amblycephala]|uniref:G-protein coupled receptor family C group 6 member A-like n=1 Tax=Megalobrama amblycephala TaxID=75352 RepID=UPI0020142A4D|nr:G-protein coupled receptor family C group 6 member A-like [Megalobrama amblycephala]
MKSHIEVCVLAVMMLSLGLWVHCDIPSSLYGSYMEGDVNIAILSSIHSKVINLHKRTRPEPFVCTDFDLVTFLQSLGAIFAIEEINNSMLLPGIKLGYEICDPCASPTKALHCVEHLLAINDSLPALSDYSDFRPPVKAFLGERYSELSIAIAKLLSLYLCPQVSTSSSSPVLSDKLRYPSFMRVIPSDVYQAQALVKLVSHFSWNWVGVVYGDDDYGRAAYQSFMQESAGKICADFEKVVPHYLDHVDVEKYIKDAAKTIRESSAKVVLLILKPQLVEKLFKEMIQTNTSRVWIASDAWAMYRPLTKMNDINKVGKIFGFSFSMGNIPGFEDYLRNLRPTPGARNYYIEEYKQLRMNCSLWPSNCTVDDILYAVDQREAYRERVAIYAIAHGLRKLLKCDETACSGETNFPPWKLVESMRSVNFTLDGNRYFFDEHGDFVDGYDLIMWKENDDERIIETVGKFLLKKGDVEIFSEYQSINNSLDSSRCSASCEPGTVKNQSKISCCYNCVNCTEGNYTNGFDFPECLRCPEGLWSTVRASKCEKFKEIYLIWTESYPIALLAATAIGLVLVFTSFIIFSVHRYTTVIKKADNTMSSFMLLGLTVSFVSVIMFIGRPTVHHCRAQQVLYGLGFTLCVSCILVKAYRTFLAFMAFDPVKQHQLKKLYKPVINLVLLTGAQGLILLLWMTLGKSPVPVNKWPGTGLEKYVVCDEGSIIGFGVMHGYIALLAFICFFLAFKGRKVPHDFNETGVIIFSMLIHLFVWLCFIPIYIERNKTEQRHIVQASAILASNYGIIFCHFVPKCYIVLWELSENSRALIMGRLAGGIKDDAASDINIFHEAGRNTPDSGINSPGVGPFVIEISAIHKDVSSTIKTEDFFNTDRGSIDPTVSRRVQVRQRHSTK